MPLEKSASKEAFGHNVGAELKAGKPRDQALAIAFDVQRRAGGGEDEGGKKRTYGRGRKRKKSEDADREAGATLSREMKARSRKG